MVFKYETLTSPTKTIMTQSSFSSGDSLSISERRVSDKYDFTFLFTVGIPITMVTVRKTARGEKREGPEAAGVAV